MVSLQVCSSMLKLDTKLDTELVDKLMKLHKHHYLARELKKYEHMHC